MNTKFAIAYFILLSFWLFSPVLKAHFNELNSRPFSTIKLVDGSQLNESPNNQYFIDLLQRALEETKAEYGDFKIMPANINISQSRQILEINKGTFDLFWSITTPGREVEALAIDQPLLNGAYGIRLLVAKRDKINELDNVDEITLSERYSAYLGKDWPDSSILRLNRYQVTAIDSDQDIYRMLKYNDFAYFPRGLFEAHSELKVSRFKDYGIAHKHILVYPSAMKFFVAKHNTVLAERLNLGLKRLNDRGEIDEMIVNFSEHKETFKSVTFDSPTIHRLENRLLPESVNKDQLWAAQKRLLARFGIAINN